MSAALRRFEGKVALITGAAAGIGRATAERLASEGAGVCCVDLSAEGVEETVLFGLVAGARPPLGPLGDQKRMGTTTATIAAAAAVSVVRRRVRRRSRPIAAAAKSPGASIRAASSCRVWRRSSSFGLMP